MEKDAASVRLSLSANELDTHMAIGVAVCVLTAIEAESSATHMAALRLITACADRFVAKSGSAPDPFVFACLDSATVEWAVGHLQDSLLLPQDHAQYITSLGRTLAKNSHFRNFVVADA